MKKALSALIVFLIITVLVACAEDYPNVSEIGAPSDEEFSISDISEKDISEESRTIPSFTDTRFYDYYTLFESGTYRLTVTESKTVGGESVPYTVDAFHKDGMIYAEITESYGATSRYIIKDGKIIMLDFFGKSAEVLDYSPSLFSERVLWGSDITVTDSVPTVIYETIYNSESFADERGKEFTLYFNGDKLERYRYYDSVLMDTVTLSVTLTDDITGAIFDIPEEFTIE